MVFLLVLINMYGFGDLPNIESIIIPASVESIYYNGIYFFNSSFAISKGLSQVFIEAYSRLKFIDHIFSYKETVIVFCPTKIHPSCNHNIFENVTNKYLISYRSFSFCGFHFKGQSTFIHQIPRNFLNLCSVSLLHTFSLF